MWQLQVIHCALSGRTPEQLGPRGIKVLDCVIRSPFHLILLHVGRRLRDLGDLALKAFVGAFQRLLDLFFIRFVLELAVTLFCGRRVFIGSESPMSCLGSHRLWHTLELLRVTSWLSNCCLCDWFLHFIFDWWACWRVRDPWLLVLDQHVRAAALDLSLLRLLHR